eukprot:Gb_27568 [translate_table: standard]
MKCGCGKGECCSEWGYWDTAGRRKLIVEISAKVVPTMLNKFLDPQTNPIPCRKRLKTLNTKLSQRKYRVILPIYTYKPKVIKSDSHGRKCRCGKGECCIQWGYWDTAGRQKLIVEMAAKVLPAMLSYIPELLLLDEPLGVEPKFSLFLPLVILHIIVHVPWNLCNYQRPPARLSNGYLGPEYVMHSVLIEKTDMYNFRVMALEIVRSHTYNKLQEEMIYLLEWAWHLYTENRLLDLVDVNFHSSSSKEEALRIIHVASLCS